jgi:hypothetical protein
MTASEGERSHTARRQHFPGAFNSDVLLNLSGNYIIDLALVREPNDSLDLAVSS